MRRVVEDCDGGPGETSVFEEHQFGLENLSVRRDELDPLFVGVVIEGRVIEEGEISPVEARGLDLRKVESLALEELGEVVGAEELLLALDSD